MAVNNAVNLVPAISGTANQIAVSQVGAAATIALASSVINTSQPMFMAYLSANAVNVTGDGTVYTILFDTVSINQGSSYNAGTGIFTAPITGKYLFSSSCIAVTGTTRTAVQFQVTNTTINYLLQYDGNSPAAIRTETFGNSIIIPMSSADTSKIQIIVSGAVKDTTVVGAAGQVDTYFCGYLLP